MRIYEKVENKFGYYRNSSYWFKHVKSKSYLLFCFHVVIHILDLFFINYPNTRNQTGNFSLLPLLFFVVPCFPLFWHSYFIHTGFQEVLLYGRIHFSCVFQQIWWDVIRSRSITVFREWHTYSASPLFIPTGNAAIMTSTLFSHLLTCVCMLPVSDFVIRLLH